MGIHGCASSIWILSILSKCNLSPPSPGPLALQRQSGLVIHASSITKKGISHIKAQDSQKLFCPSCGILWLILLLFLWPHEEGHPRSAQSGFGRCLYVLRACDAEARYRRSELHSHAKRHRDTEPESDGGRVRSLRDLLSRVRLHGRQVRAAV